MSPSLESSKITERLYEYSKFSAVPWTTILIRIKQYHGKTTNTVLLSHGLLQGGAPRNPRNSGESLRKPPKKASQASRKPRAS
eukprot:1374770-Amorphochlora_amoeboformis.AAC.1